MKKNHITSATVLTLVRLFLSPLLLPGLLVWLLPQQYFIYNAIGAAVFALLALTDFLDGYIARKFDQQTSFGRMLDPIADKFLLYATLLGLVAAQRMCVVWPVVFIGREFFVMGLRQAALESGCVLYVSQSAKFKTAFLSISLFVIILNPWGYDAWQLSPGIYFLELALLVISTFFSLQSAATYYRLWSRNC